LLFSAPLAAHCKLLVAQQNSESFPFAVDFCGLAQSFGWVDKEARLSFVRKE
jgi:hypothetical protein